MIKTNRILACVAMFLATTGVASADSFMWFELDTNLSSPGVTVFSGGAEGEALVLTKPAEAGLSTIVLNLQARVANSHLAGYSMDLVTDPGNLLEAVANTRPSDFGDGGGETTYGSMGVAPLLTNDLGEARFNFSSPNGGLAPGGTYTIMKLTLEMTKELSNLLNSYAVFAEVGAFSWDDGFDDQGEFVDEFAQFGPSGTNLPVLVGDGGQDQSFGVAPVLVIQNVPEPGTIALLGLGSLAMFLRRRQAVR